MRLKGSARHIRWYVNDGEGRTQLRDCGSPAVARRYSRRAPIERVSPRPPDYQELWNERFLEGIGRPDSNRPSHLAPSAPDTTTRA